MAPRSRNPADRIVRTRLTETLHFPDLTERLTLALANVPRYTARSHFGPWHRILGTPDFEGLTGIFSPLAHVDLAVEEVPCELGGRVSVHGEAGLARTLDAAGATRNLVRDGRHVVRRPDGVEVARARLVNVFTRYDPDPARRRVTELPASMGLGSGPSRVVEVPALDDLAPRGRRPDFAEEGLHVWHFGQTDANRHVNGMAYLRAMEGWVADVLDGAGQDLRRIYPARARIVYRKPCFRGERYRRVAWVRGEAPLVVTGAFRKADDPPDAPPAAAIELTFRQHADATPV